MIPYIKIDDFGNLKVPEKVVEINYDKHNSLIEY